jgi:hypothetical protein
MTCTATIYHDNKPPRHDKDPAWSGDEQVFPQNCEKMQQWFAVSSQRFEGFSGCPENDGAKNRMETGAPSRYRAKKIDAGGGEPL